MKVMNSHGLLTPEQFLAELPKVNLHCHLQGTVSSETVISLAEKHGLAVPLNPRGELFDLVDRRSPEDRERRFFELLDIVTAVIQDHDDFARVAYELLRDHAAPQNVRYLEIFFPPSAFPAVPYKTILDGICDGLDRAQRDFGVQAALVPAILREQGPAVAEQMVRDVIANPHRRVVGIALEGPEELDEHRPAHFESAFRIAKNAGLRRTAHATLADPVDVVACIEVLDCDRIDHGYRILESPELADRIRAEGRTVTVCPTITKVVFGGPEDERWLAAATHPARQMIEAGLPVSIGTDDGCVVPCDLNEEYRTLLGGDLFDPDLATRVAVEGARAAWLPEKDREMLVDSFSAEIAALRRRLRPTATQ